MVNYGTATLDHSVQGLGGRDLQNLISERASAANAKAVDPDHDVRGCKVAFSYSYPLPGEEESAGASAGPGDDGTIHEVGMAKRLRSVGWDIVAIDFPMPLPFAHNRIMAMSRGPIHTWMNAPGRRAVLHVVDVLVEHFDSHEALFRPTSSQDMPAALGRVGSLGGVADDGAGMGGTGESTISR